MVAHEFPLGIDGLLEIFTLASAGVEKEWYLQLFGIAYAVHVYRRAIGTFGGNKIVGPIVGAFLRVPGLLRHFHQPFVARASVSPGDALDIDRVAALGEHVRTAQQVVFCERRRDAFVACRIVLGLHSPEEHSHRPHLETAVKLVLRRIPKARVAKHSVRRGVVQRVVDAVFALRNQLGVAQRVAEPEKTVGVIRRLLVSPPAVHIRSAVHDPAGPQTRIVRIAQGLGVSRQAIRLCAADFSKPAARTRGGKQPVLEPGVQGGTGCEHGHETAFCAESEFQRIGWRDGAFRNVEFDIGVFGVGELLHPPLAGLKERKRDFKAAVLRAVLDCNEPLRVLALCDRDAFANLRAGKDNRLVIDRLQRLYDFSRRTFEIVLRVVAEAEKRRGEDYSLGKLPRPRIAGKLLLLEDDGRVVGVSLNETIERQDAVVLRRKRSLVARNVPFMTADRLARDLVRPSLLATARFYATVVVCHEPEFEGVCESLLVPRHLSARGRGMEINLYAYRTRRLHLRKILAARFGIAHFLGVDPHESLDADRLPIVDPLLEARPLVHVAIAPVAPPVVDKIILEAQRLRPVVPLLLFSILGRTRRQPLPDGAAGAHELRRLRRNRCGRGGTKPPHNVARRKSLQILGDKHHAPGRRIRALLVEPVRVVRVEYTEASIAKILRGGIGVADHIRLGNQAIRPVRELRRHGEIHHSADGNLAHERGAIRLFIVHAVSLIPHLRVGRKRPDRFFMLYSPLAFRQDIPHRPAVGEVSPLCLADGLAVHDNTLRVHRLCARRERDRRRECASRQHDFPSHFAAPFTFASRRFSSSQRSGWL